MQQVAVREVADWAETVASSVERSFLGNRAAIERCLVALLCRGHVLIEDVPGVGKTLLARSLAKTVGGSCKQVQCTPDLMPADILGVSVFNPATSDFTFRQGPIMTNVLLVDEINRATPRTQSALLEAMAEGQVSVEGRTLALPDPFFLVATQSPAESEGTFPLPEVQKDRFFLSLRLGYPSRDTERSIIVGGAAAEGADKDEGAGKVLAMQEAVVQVHVADEIKSYVMEIVGRTRSDHRLTMGISPRGSLALYKAGQGLAALRGRDYVVPEDTKEMAEPVLRSRILVKSEWTARGISASSVIEELLSGIEVPGYKR